MIISITKKSSLFSFVGCLSFAVLAIISLNVNATGKHFSDELPSSQNSNSSSPSIAKNMFDGTTKNVTRIVTTPLEKSAELHEIYFLHLLELAMQKTESTDGPFVIEQYPNRYTNKRFIAELTRDENTINIIWTMNDKKREKELLPIKISLLRGMNSHRVFLIRKEDQPKFHKVRSLKDLSKFTAGQGANWPDTPIMQSNGLQVITSAHFELLFTMLAAKRFDYFPRGVYEAWDEVALHGDKGFIVEDSIMLHYPAPIYFFVNRQNVALANRIERGLAIAKEDGSFDALFFSIPAFKKGFEEMKSSSRRVFNLTTHGADED